MNVTFVDLRRNMRRIRRAIDRNESVTLLYRGKPKAVINPIPDDGVGTPARPRVRDDPAFGMWKDRKDMEDVYAYVRKIRTRRLP